MLLTKCPVSSHNGGGGVLAALCNNTGKRLRNKWGTRGVLVVLRDQGTAHIVCVKNLPASDMLDGIIAQMFSMLTIENNMSCQMRKGLTCRTIKKMTINDCHQVLHHFVKLS